MSADGFVVNGAWHPPAICEKRGHVFPSRLFSAAGAVSNIRLVGNSEPCMVCWIAWGGDKVRAWVQDGNYTVTAAFQVSRMAITEDGQALLREAQRLAEEAAGEPSLLEDEEWLDRATRRLAKFHAFADELPHWLNPYEWGKGHLAAMLIVFAAATGYVAPAGAGMAAWKVYEEIMAKLDE